MNDSTLETQNENELTSVCVHEWLGIICPYFMPNSSTVIFACIPKESISIMILINASTLYPPVTILSSALSSAYLLR